MQHLSSWARRISLGIKSPGFIYFIANGRISFFLKLNSIPLHVFTKFSYSSINKYLGHLHILAIVNNFAVTQESKCLFKLLISILLDEHPGVGLLDPMVILFLIF